MARVDSGFIKSSFLEATRGENFQNKWMSSDTWAKLIAKYCITDSTLIFNGTELNKCLNSRQNVHLREQMDMKSNIPKDHIGIFRDTLRKHGCKVMYYYYATEKGQLPLKTEAKWYDTTTDAKELLEKVLTRSTSQLTTISLNDGLYVTKKRKLAPPQSESGLESSEALLQENKSLLSDINNVLTSSSDCHCPPTKLDYFDSPEARKLFGTREDENTCQSINAQIFTLQAANDGDKGYIAVLYQGEEIDEDSLTERFKHNLRQKCQILSFALQLALEQMNGWTWTKCYEIICENRKQNGCQPYKEC